MPENIPATADIGTVTEPPEEKPSYTKLAMRNMVKKKHLSIFHFFLTFAGFMAVMVALSYLTR
jgi:hypothetical protein